MGLGSYAGRGYNEWFIPDVAPVGGRAEGGIFALKSFALSHVRSTQGRPSRNLANVNRNSACPVPL
ncbi:MAG: hypothetical protein CSA61_01045 [Neptuniibacter caesariensis]|uniref:Uncharacterized protein n=1 Tax=Neptuniibacter caesariensis TaxID=207954 RepID=A0A2G6JBG3_NEPCE|nr:MAG: hypothetical protein CSA61_01045 [Neptuniibacter caesariensis]